MGYKVQKASPRPRMDAVILANPEKMNPIALCWPKSGIEL